MDESLQDHIEDYFDGRLSEEQREQFEQRRQNDPTFAREVEHYLQARAIAANLAQKGLREKAAMMSAEHTRSRTINLRRWVAAAAIALIVIVAGTLLNRSAPTPDILYAEYFEMPLPSSSRNDQSESAQWQQAISQYANGDHELAKDNFQSLAAVDTFPRRSEAQFFYGICLMQLDKYNEAITEFEKINGDDAYARDAQWYAALAHIKVGEKDDAERLLNEIADEGGFRSKDATDLLRDLGK